MASKFHDIHKHEEHDALLDYCQELITSQPLSAIGMYCNLADNVACIDGDLENFREAIIPAYGKLNEYEENKLIAQVLLACEIDDSLNLKEDLPNWVYYPDWLWVLREEFTELELQTHQAFRQNEAPESMHTKIGLTDLIVKPNMHSYSIKIEITKPDKTFKNILIFELPHQEGDCRLFPNIAAGVAIVNKKLLAGKELI